MNVKLVPEKEADLKAANERKVIIEQEFEKLELKVREITEQLRR